MKEIFRPENLPPLRKGHKLVGPSFYRCFNTGLEPTVRYIQLPAMHGERGTRQTRYVVGPDLAGMEVARRVFHAAWKGTLDGQRIYTEDGRKVFVYKTAKPALSHFCDLCNEVAEENEKIREAHRRDMEAAQKGDLEAALRLGDY